MSLFQSGIRHPTVLQYLLMHNDTSRRLQFTEPTLNNERLFSSRSFITPISTPVWPKSDGGCVSCTHAAVKLVMLHSVKPGIGTRTATHRPHVDHKVYLFSLHMFSHGSVNSYRPRHSQIKSTYSLMDIHKNMLNDTAVILQPLCNKVK